MSKTKELIIEDFERLSLLDRMYLGEKEQEMINEWQQWDEQTKLPAKIVVKKTQKKKIK